VPAGPAGARGRARAALSEQQRQGQARAVAVAAGTGVRTHLCGRHFLREGTGRINNFKRIYDVIYPTIGSANVGIILAIEVKMGIMILYNAVTNQLNNVSNVDTECNCSKFNKGLKLLIFCYFCK